MIEFCQKNIREFPNYSNSNNNAYFNVFILRSWGIHSYGFNLGTAPFMISYILLLLSKSPPTIFYIPPTISLDVFLFPTNLY